MIGRTTRRVFGPGLILLLARTGEAIAAEGGESPGIFAGDIGNIIWTLATFLVVVAVLGRFAWGPILSALQKREEFIRQSLEQAIREELLPSATSVVQHDLEKALKAYGSMENHAGLVTEGEVPVADSYQRPAWIELPFENAGISAPAIHGAATSVLVKTGLWRTMRPVINYNLCHRCWACSALCPDGAVEITDGEPHIDYDHCKGCLICVSQCPYHAMLALPEHQFVEASS